ncbi:carbohydrate kinase family protein [Alloiococcus sp. CFN-8]|uniref:carbohydrate kinase family protein n=1 Tax=Alloiococcus sp. CFN-8 TaxID=3416081 RepID=UPI003CF0A040
MKRGISIAGTMTVDYYKVVEEYPKKGMLSYIKKVSRSVGGCVPNTIINLAKIDKALPLYAIGGIGEDENGEYLLKALEEYNIATSGIVKYPHMATAFTDAMMEEKSRERTFFFSRGVSDGFSYEDIDIASIKGDIFHLGYAFLMAPFDREDNEFGTVMAKLLKEVQGRGIKTSIDLVSVDNTRYSELVSYSLKYCNYFIVNEIEAGKTAGIEPFNENGEIDKDKIRIISKRIIDLGVKDLVVIHSPQGAWALDSKGSFYEAEALCLPKGYIKGSVGAGDAFCAGMLYSIYKELPVQDGLKLACAAAAASLGEEDSISGMVSYEELVDGDRHMSYEL